MSITLSRLTTHDGLETPELVETEKLVSESIAMVIKDYDLDPSFDAVVIHINAMELDGFVPERLRVEFEQVIADAPVGGEREYSSESEVFVLDGFLRVEKGREAKREELHLTYRVSHLG